MSAKVLIVGAGPNGLAAARACRTFGVEYDQVERHSDVGGIWDRDNPGSPIYESAHFISSKTMSGFLGFPMPDSFPDYPSRPQILSYLRDFADAFGLRDGIRFRTSVTTATALGQGGWEVTLSDGSTQTYGAVIACTGTQWLPVMPSYPGTSTRSWPPIRYSTPRCNPRHRHRRREYVSAHTKRGLGRDRHARRHQVRRLASPRGLRRLTGATEAHR